MGKGAQKPEAPDPYQTAATESQFNRLDVFGPGGSGVRYGYTGEDGEFVGGVAPEGFQAAQSYIESPFEAQIRETLQPASTELVGTLVEQNLGGLPGPARVKDFEDVATQLYEAGYNRMQPSFEAESDRLLSNLQARGIPVGSEAFNEAYKAQQRSVTDALTNLTSQATAAAGGEQSRQFGLDAAQRSGSLNELISAMTGAYEAPTNLPSGQASGVNYSGLVGQKYQSDLAAYEADLNRRSQAAGTLGNLGGAMLMKSDRRVKTDIVQIGRRGPLNLYAYRYIWDAPGVMRMGYMAQEVLKVIPDAVRKVGAWLAVDYSKLPEVDHA